MVVYSIKDLMSLCSDYALEAEVQKILFSCDLWVPKAARVRLNSKFLVSCRDFILHRKYKLIMLHNNDMQQRLFLVLIALGLFFSWMIKLLFILKSDLIFIHSSPSKNDNITYANNRLRRTFGLRSMSAEVFHSSVDSGSSGS